MMTQTWSWDEIFWSCNQPQGMLSGKTWLASRSRIPSWEVPPWKLLKVRYMFHNHSISRTLAPGPCCELETDFSLDISDPGLSYWEGQHYSSILSTPILVVCGALGESVWSWRVFSKLLCYPRKSWCFMIAFSFPSAACLLKKKKKILREKKTFCYTSKS